MAEYIIDKIAYGGDVYKLQDNQSGYITTETDPIFNASPAAGISATDISNWNAKVSDDHKWAAVTLGDGRSDNTDDLWIPSKTNNDNTSGTAYWIKTTQELPTSAAIESVQIPRYKKINNSWYLQSTTPSANDNSTKVATTAYVDGAIPSISLNGSSTTSASFYAPTSAGTSGQVLTSNGSGAPTWAAAPSGGGDIFYATYNVTTSAEIEAAYQAGKTIFTTYSETANNIIYYYVAPFAQKTGNMYTFICNKGDMMTGLICTNDVWTTVDIFLQTELISGNNIKTINNQSILGSGNLSVGSDPLIGTTANTTPIQVQTAIDAGRPVIISHTDSTYGTFVVTSFTKVLSLGIIIGSVTAQISNRYFTFNLTGDLSNIGIWSFSANPINSNSAQIIRWIES